MATIINPSQRAIKNYPADDRWMFWDGTNFRPYISVAEVNANVPTGKRHIGLFANVGGAMYWYKDGITDSDLVLFSGSGTSETPETIKTKYESNANTNAFTDTYKSKLDGLESGKFKGVYVTESALIAANVGETGAYAYVDGGSGGEVHTYIWSDTDSAWVLQLGISNAETAASIKSKYESNPDTNAFTDAEKSKLAAMVDSFTTALKNAYDGAVNWISTNGSNLIAHLTDYNNPHQITKTQLGLGNVDNTADADKPISTAAQAAIDAKQDKLQNGVTIKTINNTPILGSGNIVLAGSDATTTDKGILKLAGDLAGTADNPTVPALATLQSQITTLDSTKLNAADYNDRYKGKFTTLSALQSAHPTANAGDYAQVDTGAGSDVKNYNWDAEDGWVIGGTVAASTTDALPEGSTNLYFTTARAIAAVDISGKVDKVTGKQLSTEDYTTSEKTKLAGIAAGAQVNDANTTLQGNTFNGANQLVKLGAAGKLPAIDGSQLTNLPSGGATIDDSAPSLSKVYSSQKIVGIEGLLTNLNTTDKSTMVNAINEVLAKVGANYITQNQKINSLAINLAQTII